jgi:hypothetical protein
MITIKNYAKFVVGLGEKVAPTDIEEGMRVGVIININYFNYIIIFDLFKIKKG